MYQQIRKSSVEEGWPVRTGITSQVRISQLRHFSSARCPLEESLLDQEWLIDLLYRTGVFPQGRGNGAQSDGASGELVYDGGEELVIHIVQSVTVDIQGFESIAGYRFVNGTGSLDLCKVPYTAQKALAIRGVPRIRPAISTAASCEQDTSRMRALRSTIPVIVCTS